MSTVCFIKIKYGEQLSHFSQYQFRFGKWGEVGVEGQPKTVGNNFLVRTCYHESFGMDTSFSRSYGAH